MHVEKKDDIKKNKQRKLAAGGWRHYCRWEPR